MSQRSEGMLGPVADSRGRTLVAVVAGGISFGFVEFILHTAFAHLGVSPIVDSVVDASLVGITFGALSWVYCFGYANVARDSGVRLRGSLSLTTK